MGCVGAIALPRRQPLREQLMPVRSLDVHSHLPWMQGVLTALTSHSIVLLVLPVRIAHPMMLHD
jgi:hypothetical protein